jgi:hypothetical protein
MRVLAFFCWASFALAAKHHLLVTSVQNSSVFVLEFDVENVSLNLIGEYRTTAPHPSIAIDVCHTLSNLNTAANIPRKPKDFFMEWFHKRPQYRFTSLEQTTVSESLPQ